jgi:hypothetical protein
MTGASQSKIGGVRNGRSGLGGFLSSFILSIKHSRCQYFSAIAAPVVF